MPSRLKSPAITEEQTAVFAERLEKSCVNEENDRLSAFLSEDSAFYPPGIIFS